MSRRTWLLTVVTLVGAAAAADCVMAASVRVAPGRIQALARPGLAGQLTISNPGRGRIRVTLAPREWRQARGGAVVASATRLGGVALSPSTFDLAAGAARTVRVSATRIPRAGYLYGAIVTRASDVSPSGRPVRVGAAIVSSLRLLPRTPVRRVQVGTVVARRRAKRVIVVRVPLRNAGNQIDALTGSIAVQVGRRVRRVSLPRTILLPGTSTVVETRRVAIPRGQRRVTVTVLQNGRRAAVRRTRISVR